MKNTAGFTLIELMIVVAIIGILASVSLPSYQSYTARAKVAEAITLVSEFKPGIIDYYKVNGEFPADNAQAGVPESRYVIGNYVRGASIENGAIHIEMGNKVSAHMKGKVLTLRPMTVIGSPESPISWVCGDSAVPEGMAPVGENKTTLGREVLPADCRG
ncbi:MAG: pilin [Ketobacteraceae bacterium]|nr:pilin [Ketobacteraceae bacterium]